MLFVSLDEHGIGLVADVRFDRDDVIGCARGEFDFDFAVFVSFVVDSTGAFVPARDRFAFDGVAVLIDDVNDSSCSVILVVIRSKLYEQCQRVLDLRILNGWSRSDR